MGNHFSLNYNCLQCLQTLSTITLQPMKEMQFIYDHITTTVLRMNHFCGHPSDNVSGDLVSDKVTTQQQHCSCCCRCCLERRHCCVLLVYHASVWFDSSEIGIIIRSKLQLLFIKLKGWGWWCNEPRVIQT